MATHLENLIAGAIASAYRAALGEDLSAGTVEIRPTDRPEFGDYSTNVALVAASNAGTSPRDLAADLAKRIEEADGHSLFREIQIAGPGFINVFLQPATIQSSLAHVLQAGDRYGQGKMGGEEQVQIEFVSSNPTGPLTVGHGRQAVLGDVLASLNEHQGFDVSREYYFNDE